jgi:hypothetical protein
MKKLGLNLTDQEIKSMVGTVKLFIILSSCDIQTVIFGLEGHRTSKVNH